MLGQFHFQKLILQMYHLDMSCTNQYITSFSIVISTYKHFVSQLTGSMSCKLTFTYNFNSRLCFEQRYKIAKIYYAKSVF